MVDSCWREVPEVGTAMTWQLCRAGLPIVRVELTDRLGGMVLRVEAGGVWLTVACARPMGRGCWRVRALLAGHEEVVATACVCAWMLGDLQEVLAGDLVEVAV